MGALLPALCPLGANRVSQPRGVPISEVTEMPNSAPKQLGKYEILEVVGRGGMGVVYKAVDPEIGRLVGIKMMTSAVINDPVLLKRFYREAQSAGKLRHPNIVTIYDLGVQEAIPYLVMEFLEGESLDVALRSGRTLHLEEKLSVVIQVCNALAYAHEQSIVHRDIKPGNVMLLKDGTVKLVDFGIARIGAEYVTRAGQLMGSIQYMSPEQVHGAHVDLRSDIFSTGVLLYQMLTNVLPFEGHDAGATLLKIVHDSPVPLGKFLQEYPPELDGILQRVLAKHPDECYQTENELALDLSHVEERLKRKRISGYLEAVERSIADGQWDKSREELLQLLKIDRQNVRASELLREVQQQIQKQQRVERIRDLQTQAEQAIAKSALDEALRYLNVSLSLDESNPQLRELRDAIQDRKQRADRVAELLARAKSSFDTEDLENALASAKQALTVDSESADAKELHAAIRNELAERAKLKQVHTHLEEARKQISSRHFTAALEVLRRAEGIDPEAPGVNELVALASAGQQQERRRKELEQFSSEIGEALNRNDYDVACAKAAEALERFPNDRGLVKLKALAEKERETSERRAYVESQVSLARRLLEKKKSAEALVPLKEALAKYPDEFVLQSMYSLFTEYLERDRAEQFKTKITQQAKEAIRRKAYTEAIEILQAAKRQTSSGEFDDLLQFSQEEAATYVMRQKIDAAAEDAHRLTSAGEYEKAIELLEATLKDADDQELRIILGDTRRHVEEFNADLQEAVTTARRLLNVQRYHEAVKFVDSHAVRFGKTPEFSQLSEEVHREQRRVQAFSIAKEQAREALANSDFKAARTVLDKYRAEFDGDVDTQLLQREIEARESESATTAVAQALKDCRVLLQVGCYRAVLDILGRVSSAAAFVPAEMKQDYDFARASAIAGMNRERLGNERFERMKRQMAHAANDPTLGDAEWATAGSLALSNSPLQETQVASVSELEDVLGQVTLIAKHYPGDQRILSAVGSVRQQLTIQIEALRRGDTAQKLAEPTKPAPVQQQQDAKVQDSAEKTRVQNTQASNEEKRSQPQAVEKPRAAAEGRRAEQDQRRSVPRSVASPATAETETFSLGEETIVSPSQEPAIATRPHQQAIPAPGPAFKAPSKTARPAPKRLGNIPAMVVAAILLVLMIYMVWRTTHRISPSIILVEINTNPGGASVRVKSTDQECVTPHCTVKLAPGQYDVEAQLQGYQTVTQPLSVNASGSTSMLIQMTPLPADSSGKR
jgi:serine/threonine-protein kinase